jgi:nucleoside-diphosphate-sugar epimerase
MRAQRIIVVGVGDIGGSLACQLADEGHHVWGMRRTDKPIGHGVKILSVDVSEPDTLSMPEDIDYVVFCVAAPVFTDEGYRKYYQVGLRNILTLLKYHDQKPKRIIFVSSTSVYQQHDAQWVDELSPVEPLNFAGKNMLAAEELLKEFQFPHTVVRLSGIYGPGRYKLINQARAGGHCDPVPETWTNRIHRDDAVAGLHFLLQKDFNNEALDDLYLLTDKEPSALHNVLDWLKERIGDVELDSDGPEVTRRGSKRCSSVRLQDLGFTFKYPTYRSGYEQVLIDLGY